MVRSSFCRSQRVIVMPSRTSSTPAAFKSRPIPLWDDTSLQYEKHSKRQYPTQHKNTNAHGSKIQKNGIATTSTLTSHPSSYLPTSERPITKNSKIFANQQIVQLRNAFRPNRSSRKGLSFREIQRLWLKSGSKVTIFFLHLYEARGAKCSSQCSSSSSFHFLHTIE